jgi:serralysin
MAIFVAGDAGIDVNDPDVEDLALADIVAGRPNYVSLRFDDWLDEFTGDFFYTASGDLAGGVITGWKQTYNGQLVFEVTGMNVAMADMLRWIEAGEDSSVVRTVFAGDDHMTGSQYSDVLSGHAGGDTLFGLGDADTLEGGAGLDYLRGGDGNDSLTGGDGFDDLHGNTGNDTVYGGLGSDWVVGGQGPTCWRRTA